MKKAIFKGFAVAALALAVLFTGCKNESSNIETIRVDAVEITAKAFPGFNYVTWTMPEDYQGNKLTVVRDDGKLLVNNAIFTISGTTTGATPTYKYNNFIDTDIKDGVTYKYTVYVGVEGVNLTEAFKGGSVTTINDVSTDYKALTKLGNSSSASVKAINPLCIKDGKLMTALDLCEYEDGGDEDFVINEDNIIFEKEANGDAYYIAFPTKQYLDYTVKVYRGNELDVFGLNASDFGSTADLSNTTQFYTNDGAKRFTCATTGAGEYTAVVQIAAVNDNYQKSYITAKNKFTVEALDVATNTVIKTPGYIDAGKTVRVIWTPATKKSDAKNWEAAKYTVYVKNTLTGIWTALAGTPVATTEEAAEAKAAEEAAATTPAISPAKDDGKQLGKTVYYFDYTVPSNEVSYDFAVVLADNGKIEADIDTTDNVTFSNKKTAPAYAKLDDIVLDNVATVSATFVDADNDGKSNDALLTITPKTSINNKDFKIKSVAYKVIAKNDNATYTAASLLLDSEITATAAAPSADYTKYDAVAKDVAVDSKVVFLYVLSYKDKADTAFVVTTSGNTDHSTYSTPSISMATDTATTKAAGVITATIKETAADGVQTWKFDYANSNEDDFKKYDYTVFYGKLDPNSASEGSVTSWTAVTLSATKNAAKTAYEATADVKFEKYTGLFGKTTNITDGKVTYTDKYVLKFVKSLKSVSDTTGIDVVYSSPITVEIVK